MVSELFDKTANGYRVLYDPDCEDNRVMGVVLDSNANIVCGVITDVGPAGTISINSRGMESIVMDDVPIYYEQIEPQTAVSLIRGRKYPLPVTVESLLLKEALVKKAPTGRSA